MKDSDPLHKFIPVKLTYDKNWLGDGAGQIILTSKGFELAKKELEYPVEIKGNFNYIIDSRLI